MYITLDKVLKHPTFKKSKILAGEGGTMREISRVSVFDCPVPPDLVEANIIDKGDFFISTLGQFEDADQVFDFIKLMAELGTSGLCIASNYIGSRINDSILSYCNAQRYPLIQIDENIPYAYIMDTINRFVSIDNLNAINELKLDKIMTSKLPGREKLNLLHSINRSLEKYIQVIWLSGDTKSEIGDSALNEEYLNRREDIFVNSKRLKILIASSANAKKLKNHMDVVKQQLADHFDDLCLGVSRVYECYDIDKGLDEAKAALEAAKTTGVRIQEYKPLSSMQLLISLKDSRELEEYHASYVKKIKEKISDDSLTDMLYTVKTYVLNHGDYKKTSKIINQHENTIRYRINKVRSALEMEDDPITFHETISLIVKIEMLIQ